MEIPPLIIKVLTSSSALFWGMKLVELLPSIIFNRTNYGKVVSAVWKLQAESCLLISVAHTVFNKNRHIFNVAPRRSRCPLTQNKLNYSYVMLLSD